MSGGIPFFNFFRDLFGGRNSDGSRNEGFFDHRDSFRKPVWQTDEDDDDDIDDFRFPGGGMNVRIFSGDPFEMARYFETQMDSMLKSFFTLPGFDEPMNTLPSVPPPDGNLRDKMLKSDRDTHDQFSPNQPKSDANLDGKITTDEFSKFWCNREEDKQLDLYKPQPQTSGRVVTKQFFRGPDGTIEQKQTVTDIEGNKETTITRQFGDKKYTVTTRIDKNGIETKTEDLVNIDENELKNFTEKWAPSNDSNRSYSGFSQFLWDHFIKLPPIIRPD